jgi:(p)ppGpp synthase/HD superfamily hydrolase
MLSDLFRAIHVAAEWHSAQRRKGAGGEPYINHLVEVGFLLSDVGSVQDQDILIAGILHDSIEDTSATPNEITDLFGSRVCHLVQAVSDDKSLPKGERKRLVLERLAHAEDAVKLIKLADLASNIRSVPRDWEPERINDYFVWSRQAAVLCAGVSVPLDSLFLSRWHSAASALGVAPGV